MDIDLKQMVMIGNTLAEEKNIPAETVHEIIEQAVAAAWRRDHGQRDQNVRATINVHRGDVDVYVVYDIVDEVEDSHLQISLEEAKQKNPKAEVGQTIEEHHQISHLGRVAAQTAKQVILQKLREAEREVVLTEFEDRVDTIMIAIVTRIDSRVTHLEIGRARGIMPASEQIQGEHYYIGQRLKVLVKTIEREGREPQLILSRGSTRFLELLFENEVPEINNGAVLIKGIAREPGVRSKVAVTSTVPNVDPVGTFVGGHGSRVKSVNSEVGDQEKIDIIVWDEDPRQYIINALNPTDIKRAEISSTPAVEGSLPRAKVYVSEDQLNVAIGRNGQNVRLAGRLTGYDIDIATDEAKSPTIASNKPAPRTTATASKKPAPRTTTGNKPTPRLTHKEKLEESLLEAIQASTSQDESGQNQDTAK